MNPLKNDYFAILFLSALSGIVLFTTVEPLALWGLFLPGLWPIFYLIDRFRYSIKKLLLTGAIFSLFLIGAIFHWVIHTLTVFGGISTWISILIFLPFTLIFSLKIPAAMVLGGISRRSRWKRAAGPTWFSFALIFTFTEAIMPQIFPWFWGNGLGANLWFVQPVDVTGILGLTFIGVGTSRYLYDFLRMLPGKRKPLVRLRRSINLRRKASLVTLPALVLVWLVYGAFQYYRMDNLQKELPTVRVAMIQPNTPLDRADAITITPEFMERLLTRIIPDLSIKAYQAAGGKLDLVVLPEASVPFFTTLDNKYTRGIDVYRPAYELMVQGIAYNTGADVLINEITISKGGEPDARGRIPLKVHNAATLFKSTGERGMEYRKRVLLAFGEYIPGLEFLQAIGLLELVPPHMRYSRFYPGEKSIKLPFTRATREEQMIAQEKSDRGKTNPEGMGFRGMDELTMTMPEIFRKEFPKDRRTSVDGTFAPLICYEVLFPSYIAGFFGGPDPDPALLVNITQDGWYGAGIETFLHFEMGRIRSVEFRRSLVRSTNSGSSGFVDIVGRHAVPLAGPVFSGQDVEAFQVWDVPLNYGAPTVFARIGNSWLYFLTGAAILRFILFVRLKKLKA